MPALTLYPEHYFKRSIGPEEEHVRFYSYVIDHIAVLAISHGSRQRFRCLYVVEEIGENGVWAAEDNREERVMSDLYEFSKEAFVPKQQLTSVFQRHQALGESAPSCYPICEGVDVALRIVWFAPISLSHLALPVS